MSSDRLILEHRKPLSLSKAHKRLAAFIDQQIAAQPTLSSNPTGLLLSILLFLVSRRPVSSGRCSDSGAAACSGPSEGGRPHSLPADAHPRRHRRGAAEGEGHKGVKQQQHVEEQQHDVASAAAAVGKKRRRDTDAPAAAAAVDADAGDNLVQSSISSGSGSSKKKKKEGKTKDKKDKKRKSTALMDD